MVKGWGELRSLAPFSWDTRVDDHPPGQAAMRDFSDAYAYARSTERPRRSTGQYAQTPTPLTSTKRRLTSSGKEGGSTSRKRLARAGQDKENEHTPSTGYASSRLALASPAFLTPARSDHPAHPGHGVAAALSVPAWPDAVAHSTPSVGTALTHVTPSVADGAHSTPTSEAGCGAGVLALSALVGASSRAHLGDPAHTAPNARNTPEQSDAMAQHHRHHPSAEARLNATSTQRTADAQQPSSSGGSLAKQHLSGPDRLQGVSNHTGDGQGEIDDAEQTKYDEGQPMGASPAGVRQLTPAGPALGCHAALSAAATAERPKETAVCTPDAAVAQWPDAAEMQVKAPKPDSGQLKHHAESSAAVKAATDVQSQDQVTGAITDFPVPKSRLQLQPENADPTAQQLSSGTMPMAAPLLLQSKPAVKIVASPGEPALLQQQTAVTLSVQSKHDVTAVIESPVTTLAMDAEHQAAVPVAASHRRSGQQVGGKNSRRRADDRQTGHTRMSLRSQTQVPSQKRRKVGGSRTDRSRAARSSGPANGYATRQAFTEGSTRHSSRIRSQQAHTTRTQPHLAARATSSDLAAAEALAELRHENEAESDEHSDMECEVGEEGGPRKGASGYNGIFRVTQPPLPLWVAGMQLDKQGLSSAPVLSDSKQSCPPLFRSPAASGDWSIGAATPVLQVLPRHRRSAAAAAEAMLSNGSPLSGLHKLALSICARKKGTVAAVQPSALPAKALGVTNDKENLSPVLQMQSRKPLGAASVLATPALERDRPASVGAPEAAHMEAAQLKTQQSWDKYVAKKLSGGKDGASQAELISTLQRELTQPGLGLLARACLLLRLEDARAGLLYSQYHGILAACTAEHET
ncbi:MAG: hypothetical protein FRX49_00176 [Trebouxia sp. A1-2]|nr:MAG: hypothetical protein FRX49_00176 [Trebouxia sp. A1-2]